MNIRLLDDLGAGECETDNGFGLVLQLRASIDGQPAIASIYEWKEIEKSYAYPVDEDGNQIGDPVSIPAETIREWEIYQELMHGRYR